MTTPVNQRTAPTLFDFVKAVDQAKKAGETGKVLLGTNGELSFASSGICGFVSRLWEKFSDAVLGTTLAPQRREQAQQAFEAFQAVLQPDSIESEQQSVINTSPLSQLVGEYKSISAAKLRESLLSTLQANLPSPQNLAAPRVKTPATLTAAFKNGLHDSVHTLTQAQRDKNAAYASRDQRAADVVFVIGPDTPESLIKDLRNECKRNGLKLMVIGDSRGPIPLSEMNDQLKDQVDKWTQFFVLAHGSVNREGGLNLGIGAEKNSESTSPSKEAGGLFKAIQDIKPINASDSTNPNYVTHVYACRGGAGEKSIHRSVASRLQNTPFLLHATTKHNMLVSHAHEDMLAQVGYLARCKEGGYAPLPAAQLGEAAFRSVVSTRLVIAGRQTSDKGRVLMPATKGPQQSGQGYIVARFKKMKENAATIGLTEEAAIFTEYEKYLQTGATTVLSELTDDAAFWLAVDHGNVNEVREFLKKRPDLTYKSFGDTGLSPPFIGAVTNHPDLIAFYVDEHGIDLNVQNFYGQTLLTTAVEGNSSDVIAYLLKHNVDPLAKVNGLTALSFAAKKGRLKTVDQLWRHLEKNNPRETIKAELKAAIAAAPKNKNLYILNFLKERLAELEGSVK